MIDLHAAIGFAVVGLFAIGWIWGLLAWIAKRDAGRGFWIWLAIAQVVVGLQAIVGLLVYLRGYRASTWLHYAYGIFPVLVLVIAHLVARDPADPLGTRARLEIEDRFPRGVLQDLAGRGHRFQKIGRKGEVRYGYASGASVDVERRRVEGGADPRRSHAAVAVETSVSTAQ